MACSSPVWLAGNPVSNEGETWLLRRFEKSRIRHYSDKTKELSVTGRAWLSHSCTSNGCSQPLRISSTAKAARAMEAWLSADITLGVFISLTHAIKKYPDFGAIWFGRWCVFCGLQCSAHICYRCSNFRQQEAVIFVVIWLTTHSRVIPLLLTGVAVATRVKDTSDNEMHAQFADVSGCWSVPEDGQQSWRGSKLGGEMNVLN